ncbi:unnamed protein product [Mucor hiemalis]
MNFSPLAVLEVTNLPGKGRGYKAITDIPAGAVVHVSEPLAAVVSQEWAIETCTWCFDFSYPKKQKVKALEDEEIIELMSRWKLIPSNKKKVKNSNMISFKDMLFCSEDCKQNYKSLGSQQEEWYRALGFYYRMELELKKSLLHNVNVPVPEGSVGVEEQHSEWIDFNDDDALTAWLNHVWDILTIDLDLYKEIDSNDKTMCRLIAACISRKMREDEEISQPADSDLPKFRDLLTVQNNEISHFRSQFGPRYPKRLPLHLKKNECLFLLPIEVLEVMALYSFFSRTLHQNLDEVPTMSGVSHSLFRSIYFRERSNSFGLWEMGDIEIAKGGGGVADDLELLGWGLFPSAVYFNHSCDANVYKVRDGRKIKFIARRMIEQDEEACISYGSVGGSLEERRSRLLENYHFLCNCTRCNHEDVLYRTVSR